MVESTKANINTCVVTLSAMAGRAQQSLVADPVKPVQKVDRLRGETGRDRRLQEDLAAAGARTPTRGQSVGVRPWPAIPPPFR
jgi:hypothetical protein